MTDTKIPQDVIDDAKAAGLLSDNIFDQQTSFEEQIAKLCALRDQRQAVPDVSGDAKRWEIFCSVYEDDELSAAYWDGMDSLLSAVERRFKDAVENSETDSCHCPTHGDWLEASDYYRNCKALDVALNGEDKAAERPILIDMLAQIEGLVRQYGKPLIELIAPPSSNPEGVWVEAVEIQVAEDDFAVELKAHGKIQAGMKFYTTPPAADAKPDGKAFEYVHSVPDHCDRVVWRGYYYHLPITRPSDDAMRNAAKNLLNAIEYGQGPTLDEVHQEYKVSAVDEAIEELRQAIANGEGKTEPRIQED